MAKLIYTVLAENIITDSSENKVTIVNVIESLNAPSFPAAYPLMFVQCLWEKELTLAEEESFFFRLNVKFNYENGTEENKDYDSLQLIIPPGKNRMRAIIRLQGLAISGQGIAIFQIEKKIDESWETIGEYPVDVKSQNI